MASWSPSAASGLRRETLIHGFTQVGGDFRIGQQASLLYFVARYLRYDAHLYDGSFQDWSNRSELPVEKSVTP